MSAACSMACYRPLDGYRLESGAVSVAHEPKGSTGKVMIPCGRCIGCRLERSGQWALRCSHEASLWDANMFVTLTYDDEHLEWHRSLVPDHLSKFLKRLRKAHDGNEKAPDGRHPIRYFAAGEYGSRTLRPHFHLLLFNASLPRGRQATSTTWECDDLRLLWPFGNHAVGSVTPASAAYVAQYSMKKVYGRVERERAYSTVDTDSGEVFDRVPEFVRMSRRPGLGHWWLGRYSRDVERGYVVSDGSKKRLPRYYRRYLEDDPDVAYGLEDKRESFILSQDPANRSPERLAAREAIEIAKRKTFSSPRGL